MTHNDSTDKPDDRNGVTIDMTKGAKGNEFTYKEHDCRITSNGIRPAFKINGEHIPLNTIEDVTGHAGRGTRAWKETLKNYIDSEETTY